MLKNAHESDMTGMQTFDWWNVLEFQGSAAVWRCSAFMA